MSRADKKRRHEAKRKAKRVQIKRQQSISPFKRLVDAPGEIEYWMSQTLGAIGQMQIYVYKRAAGLTGVAVFLIDRGVVGLKDAYARTNIAREEFDNMLDGAERRGIPMSRVTIEDVRRVVAGGIRWANENGMRLPKDWAKPASMIGGVGDWASADVSEFVSEFAGHPEDLRLRLIGEPFESYIRRPDIRFIFSDAAPVMDPRTGKYLEPKSWEFVEDEDADVALDTEVVQTAGEDVGIDSLIHEGAGFARVGEGGEDLAVNGRSEQAECGAGGGFPVAVAIEDHDAQIGPTAIGEINTQNGHRETVSREELVRNEAV